MDTKQTGGTTEAKVIADLVSRGYSVSIPFGDNDPYDLVVDDEGTLYRVQCKTAWTNKENTMGLNTRSQTTKNGTFHENAYGDEIDAFVVRYPENGSLYWIDIDDATDRRWGAVSTPREPIPRSTGRATTSSMALSDDTC